MEIRITRRAFFRLSGGAVLSLTGASTLPPALGSSAPSARTPDEHRRRTYEALITVLLPGRGSLGTPSDDPGVLEANVYGLNFYEHLVDPYYEDIITLDLLDAGTRGLDLAALCVNPLAGEFWRLTDAQRLGVVAVLTQAENEGKAPTLGGPSQQCIRLGTHPDITRGMLGLSLFAGILFYSSEVGAAWLKGLGYPGPNWGYHQGTAWAPLENPHLRDEDLDLMGGPIPSIAPGIVPPEFLGGKYT